MKTINATLTSTGESIVIMIDKIRNLEKSKHTDTVNIVFIDGDYMNVSESLKTLQVRIESKD